MEDEKEIIKNDPKPDRFAGLKKLLKRGQDQIDDFKMNNQLPKKIE